MCGNLLIAWRLCVHFKRKTAHFNGFDKVYVNCIGKC